MSFTQAQERNTYFSGSVTPGFLLAHRPDIKHLAAHNYGLEVAYEKEVENTLWGSYYVKPSIGYTLQYYSFGKEETGYSLGLFAHTKFNLLRIGNTDIKWRMGVGLAHLSEKFELEDNRRNQAIGSHLNGSMQFGLIAHKDLFHKRDFIEYGISISHFSNAAFKIPNLGYNLPSVTFRYGWGYKKLDTPSTVSQRRDPVMRWRASLIYGRKQADFAAPRDFNNYGIQLRGIRKVNGIKAWRFGLDYTLDKTYRYFDDPSFPLDSISMGDKSELGINAGYQWNFGNVDVVGELGVYAYRPGSIKTPLYQRMGIVYKVTRNVSVQGMLRFHTGVADFLEMGVNYTLWR